VSHIPLATLPGAIEVLARHGKPIAFISGAEQRPEKEEEADFQASSEEPSQGLEPWTPSLPSGSEQEPESIPDHACPFVDEDPDS
jgi:hypothetical protein